MIVPVSVMVLGLMVFVGRGAVDAIGAGPGDVDRPSDRTSTQSTTQGDNP
jgi:hypothetical protein